MNLLVVLISLGLIQDGFAAGQVVLTNTPPRDQPVVVAATVVPVIVEEITGSTATIEHMTGTTGLLGTVVMVTEPTIIATTSMERIVKNELVAVAVVPAVIHEADHHHHSDNSDRHHDHRDHHAHEDEHHKKMTDVVHHEQDGHVGVHPVATIKNTTTILQDLVDGSKKVIGSSSRVEKVEDVVRNRRQFGMGMGGLGYGGLGYGGLGYGGMGYGGMGYGGMGYGGMGYGGFGGGMGFGGLGGGAIVDSISVTDVII